MYFNSYDIALILFWTSLGILFYTYIGYGIIIYIFNLFMPKTKRNFQSSNEWPHITFLVAAYNESDFILEKIYNTIDLDYPREKLQFFVVSDGSDDDTPDKVKKFNNVRLFHQAERKGKIHAVNRVMHFVDTPYVVFSDANTMLNKSALKQMIGHYRDEKVGGVSGEKRIVDKAKDNASGSGEGLYWKYESFLKRMDSDLHSMVGSAGELFSIRTSLYEPPKEDMVIEDFYISMRIAARGFKFVYEPNAMATETASASVIDEWKRKVRISAGGIQAIIRLSTLLNMFKYGMLSFQYISHRVLRWTLAPLSLLILFVANVYIVAFGPALYSLFMMGQLFFYLMAALGYFLRDQNISIKGFFVPFYFAMMNFAVYAGVFRYINKKQAVTWEKTKRAIA
ncbi:MAG: glycosyltransferase family 2 protein [Marinoscillum sp.]